MFDIKELCKDAVDGIKDNEGIYTEDKLIKALKHIVRENMDYRNKKIINTSFSRAN